jgi:hypothetical protein
MPTPRTDDLATMLMQIAHAVDMVNHLPDPDAWTDDQLDAFPVEGNELRLLRHAARESWAINARLLSQFFLGDKHGLDARSYLPSWTGRESAVLETWKSVSSEHVAHFSPRRVMDPVRQLPAVERRQVLDAINREANRFACKLDEVEMNDWGAKMRRYLAGLRLDGAGPDPQRSVR